MTIQEKVKWLGIRLALALERPRGRIYDHFVSKERFNKHYEAEGTIFEAPNYMERFGMSDSRFKLINECLAFADPNQVMNPPVSTIFACI